MTTEVAPSAPLALTIASKLACVGPLGEQVRAACLALGLPPEAAGEVEISVVEVVNNVIEHAYLMAEDRVVELLLLHDGGRLRIEIRDDGHPMSRETLRRASAPEFDVNDGASLPEGGMGLYLVKQLMEDVRYEHRDGKNVLTMERRIDRRTGRAQT